jgi:DNA replication and repair protein RecF
MYLTQLELTGFRNIEKDTVYFKPGVNVLFGKNGQGKTSILEALYLLALSKSFKANSEKSYLNYHSEYCDVKGYFHSENADDFVIRLYYSNAESKHLFFNTNRLRRFSNILGKAPIVMLSLNDLSLTFGTPADRRKFLDILLSQISPVYLSALQNYKRSLAQRNKLLSLISQHQENPAELDIWDQQLVNEGAILIEERMKLIQYIQQKINESYMAIAEMDDQISIEYIPTLWKKEEPEPKRLTEHFSETLKQNRNSDIKRETTQKGPHRDDLEFLKNERLLKQFGSQGENKTFLIALKFIESAFLKENLGKTPLLLLDDIFGELDEYRIEHLISHIGKAGQSFITTTLRNKFESDAMNDIHFIEVNGGKTYQ